MSRLSREMSSRKCQALLSFYLRACMRARVRTYVCLAIVKNLFSHFEYRRKQRTNDHRWKNEDRPKCAEDLVQFG